MLLFCTVVALRSWPISPTSLNSFTLSPSLFTLSTSPSLLSLCLLLLSNPIQAPLIPYRVCLCPRSMTLDQSPSGPRASTDARPIDDKHQDPESRRPKKLICMSLQRFPALATYRTTNANSRTGRHRRNAGPQDPSNRDRRPVVHRLSDLPTVVTSGLAPVASRAPALRHLDAVVRHRNPDAVAPGPRTPVPLQPPTNNLPAAPLQPAALLPHLVPRPAPARVLRARNMHPRHGFPPLRPRQRAHRLPQRTGSARVRGVQ
jgi:hypothetical protein